MSEQQAGPYDKDKCHFCGKSARNGVKFTAGYTKKFRDKLYDACQFCAKGEQLDEQTKG